MAIVVETAADVIRDHIARNILFSSKGYPYSDDASFLEEGIIDSMNVMELIAFVEESFGIQINDDEIMPDNFDSVSRIAAFVERKRP